jgi:hypothetical protein
VLEVELGAHGDETLHVLIDRAEADRTAARQRYARLAAPRDERPQRQDGRAHRLDELVGSKGPVDPACVERDRARRPRVLRDAHLRQQRLHRPHVLQPRDVRERERLRREQRRAEDRKRRVLGAGNAHLAGERPAALDHQLVHVTRSARRPIARA